MLATMLRFVVTFAFYFAASSGVSGPELWHVNYSDCGGVMQSPININMSKVLFDNHLRPFNFSEYGVSNGIELELENLGHTVHVSFKGKPIHVSGGGLPAPYRLLAIQFHWRSEHSINDQYHPAEVHFIHSQQPLEMPDAITHPFGEAIIAFFVKVGDKNWNYEPLLEHFGNISVADTRTTIPTFPVSQLLPPSDRYDFFRYLGSTTTPPCSESVIWSVAEPVIEMSLDQLAVLKQLYNEDGNTLRDTWRPVQNLNHRTIRSSNRKYLTMTLPSRNGSTDAGPTTEVCYLSVLVYLAMKLQGNEHYL